MSTETSSVGTGDAQREARSEGPESRVGGGAIIAIGGHEDKSGDKTILREVAHHVGSGPLVVATLASRVAGELWEEYERVFRELGVEQIDHLDIEHRDDAYQRAQVEVIERARCVFFTGGDQLRITSKLGGTLAGEAIFALHLRGGLVAGTSAGASVMSETMLVAGPGDASHRVRDSLRMAPGLGLVRGMIIDQHFAQRGRLGRLLGAVALNPRVLGIGIDEDTAIMVEENRRLRVLGSGAVYIADGRGVTGTNLTEASSDDRALSLFDVRLHVLSEGDSFDMRSRRPSGGTSERE